MKRKPVKPTIESPVKGPIVIIPGSRAEWLEHRKQGIGGSEITAVLGLSPWDSPRSVWLRKRGLAPEQAETPAMRAGRLLEGVVAAFWAEETGIAPVPGSEGDHIYADPERPFLRATPDRIYLIENGHSIENGEGRVENDGRAAGQTPGGGRVGRDRACPVSNVHSRLKEPGDHSPLSALHSPLGIGVLECKTTRKRIDPDDLPRHWFCQLQWQMGIAGARRGQIAWLSAGTDFGRVEMELEESFYEWMADRAERFWKDCVIGGREPDPVSVADMEAMFPRHAEGMLVGADEKTYETYSELVELKERLSGMEAERAELEGRLKMAIGPAEGLHWHNRTIATWKAARDSDVFDAKRFRKEHPALAAQYTTAKPGARRFLIK